MLETTKYYERASGAESLATLIRAYTYCFVDTSLQHHIWDFIDETSTLLPHSRWKQLFELSAKQRF